MILFSFKDININPEIIITPIKRRISCDLNCRFFNIFLTPIPLDYI